MEQRKNPISFYTRVAITGIAAIMVAVTATCLLLSLLIEIRQFIVMTTTITTIMMASILISIKVAEMIFSVIRKEGLVKIIDIAIISVILIGIISTITIATIIIEPTAQLIAPLQTLQESTIQLLSLLVIIVIYGFLGISLIQEGIQDYRERREISNYN